VKSSLIMLPFLSVVLHESGTINVFLGPWLNDNDLYLAFFVLKITVLKDNVKRGLHKRHHWKLFTHAAKQVGKACERLVFLPVSIAHTNKCYIFRQCTHIV
jgi:hypothetical protein